MRVEDIFCDDCRPLIIAEISQNHDGSLGQAHAFIDAVADCGADAIKYQTHIAQEESTESEPFRTDFSYEDKSRYAYWKRMEFTEEQWQGLYKHTVERGMIFLSSPFSIKALNMLNRMGVEAWKLGSGEVFNDELLRGAILTKKPILLSTGLSTFKDIDYQTSLLKKNGSRYALLYCVTAYPSTADMIDIGQIQLLRKKYGCKVGVSDHSATIYPALASMALGASIVEVHVTMSRYMFGPDIKASVDLNQLRQIVDGAKFIYTMLQKKANYNALSHEQIELKRIFAKSMYAEENIKGGSVIQKKMFKAKKPVMGVEQHDFDKYIGKRLIKSYLKGDPLRVEDIE